MCALLSQSGRTSEVSLGAGAVAEVPVPGLNRGDKTRRVSIVWRSSESERLATRSSLVSKVRYNLAFKKERQRAGRGSVRERTVCERLHVVGAVVERDRYRVEPVGVSHSFLFATCAERGTGGVEERLEHTKR